MNRKEWAKRPNRSSKWITPVRRLAIYLRDGFTCSYCGRDLHDARKHEVTLDHLRPQSKARGGEGLHRASSYHHERNLVTACSRCNCGRQAKRWTEYATAGARERILRLRRRTLNLDLARAVRRGEAERPCSHR